MAQIKYIIRTSDGSSNEAILINIKERKYSFYLNNVGEASFVINQKDAKASNIIQGRALQIERDNKIVWKGVIEDIIPYNGSSLNYIKVVAYDDMFRLQEYLLTPDTGSTVYKRTFTDKKLGSEIVSDIFDEAKAKTYSLLADITKGKTEDLLDDEGEVISITLELYAANLWDVIAGCADYGDGDFYMENGTFNFVRDKGSLRNKKFMFKYGQAGNNLVNYADSSKLSEVKNYVIGIGAGDGENLTIVTEQDSASMSKYNRREGIAVVKELNNKPVLSLATKDYLRRNKEPQHLLAIQLANTEIPFEGYDLGDRIYVDIENGVHNFSNKYRIVGAEVAMNEEDVEETMLQLNLPSNKHQ